MRIRWGNLMLLLFTVLAVRWFLLHPQDLETIWGRMAQTRRDRELLYIVIAAAVFVALCCLRSRRAGS